MPTERELRQSKTSSRRSTPVVEGGVMAALSYVGLLFLVPMLFAKKTAFTRFHLRQGIVLFVAEVVLALVMGIPIIGQLLMLAVFVLAIMGILQALAGETRPLPFIGKYAEKVKI